MADFVDKFGFDVVGVNDLQNKLVKALKTYGQEIENINRVHAKFNKDGKANSVIVQGLNEDFRKFTITLKANGGVWKNLGTDVEKTVKSLTAAQQRIQSIIQSEKAAGANRKRDLERLFGVFKTPDNDKAGFRESLSNRSDTDRAQILASHANFIQIKNSELAILKLKEKVEAQNHKAATKRYEQISAHEQKIANIRRYVQTILNKDAAERLKQIRMSELLAAHNRKVAQQQQQLQQQFQKTGVVGKKAGQEVLLSWLSVQRLFLVQVLHQAIAQLRLSFGQAVTDALTFSKSIAEIRTLSQSAGESSATWSKELIKLSNSFGLDILDVTKASYEALSNQIISSTRDFGFMREAAKLALVTNSDVTTSVNALSSVINSFGYSQAEAGRIAAVLFRTIDIGKTTLPELAQNLGRVNALSRTLGVSFVEQEAALSTLTIQGLEDHTAKSLLVNIYQKLARPSKEMIDIFNEWGVSSAELAIKTFGLGEVMSRLIAHAQKSGDFAQQLGDEFQELRAATGAAAFDLSTYTRHLAAHQDAMQKYSNAVKIVREDDSRTLQEQLTGLKNYFLEMGQTFNKYVLGFAKSFGDIDKSAQTLIATTAKLAATYLLYKGTILTVQAALYTYKFAITAVHVAQAALRGSVFATGLALNALRGIVSAAAAAFIYMLVSQWNYQRQWRERIEESVDAVREKYDKLNTESLQTGIDQTHKWGDEFDTSSQKIFKRLGQLNIAFTQHFNSMTTDTKKFNKSFREDIDRVFNHQDEAFKKRISDLKEYLRNVELDQKNISSAITSPTDIRNLKTQFSLDLAKDDIQQQIHIINQEMQGNFARLKGAQTFDEKADILAKQVKDAEKFYEITKQTNDPARMRGAQQIWLNAINAQNAAYERQLEVLRKIHETKEAELLAEQKRKQEFDDSFKAFKGLNKDTKLDDFDRMAARVEQAAAASHLSTGEQLQLLTYIQNFRTKFEQNTVAAEGQKTLAVLRSQADAAQTLMKKSKEAATASAQEVQQSLGTAITNFGGNLEKLKGFWDRNRIGGTGEDSFLGIDKLIEDLQRTDARLSTMKGQNMFSEINSEIDKMRPKLLTISSILETALGSHGFEGQDTLIHSLLTGFDSEKAKLEAAIQAGNNASQIQNSFSILTQQLSALDGVQAKVSADWQTNNTDIANSFQTVITQIEQTINTYQRLNAEMNGTALHRDGRPNETKAPSYWKGGRVGYYYSGGRGTDTQMAYLSPGEYVWDRQTTRSMYPFVQGMHRASKYQGANSGGGSNSFSFGDINVHGTGNPEQIANQVIRTLQREIRRGKVSL